MPFLFAYGPFQRGHNKHYVLQKEFATFLGNALALDYEIYDCLSMPVAVPLEGAGIQGEVYLLDDFALSRIDQTMGVNSGFFERKKATVMFENGIITQSDIYVFSLFDADSVRRKFPKVAISAAKAA
jgi:gamma-glutamylcyclotransferase (GGCT)/AIG2-like uncharacterized protein YtfP